MTRRHGNNEREPSKDLLPNYALAAERRQTETVVHLTIRNEADRTRELDIKLHCCANDVGGSGLNEPFASFMCTAPRGRVLVARTNPVTAYEVAGALTRDFVPRAA